MPKPKGIPSPHEARIYSTDRLDKCVAFAILANVLRDLTPLPEMNGRSWNGLISDVACISEDAVRNYTSVGRKKLRESQCAN